MITINFDLLPLCDHHRILDVGCGNGRHLAEASRFRNVTAVGADLCHADLVEARNRIAFHKEWGEHGGGTNLLMTADITRLPFRTHFFDLVICSEVLEHIPDHQRAAAELYRVLKPGGNLAVSVPRYLPERLCWALSREYFNVNGGHVRIYRRAEIIRLMEETGVRFRGRHFAHGIHSPYWWLKCLFGPDRENAWPVKRYHDLLVWDIMKKPRLTRTIDRWLTPIIGKSLVLYFQKPE